MPGFRSLLVLVLALPPFAPAASRVQPVPVPPEMLSTDFRVTVNGKPVEVARAAASYSFVDFDFTGTAKVEITAARPGFWDRGVDIEPWRPESDPGAMARPSASSSKVPPNSRSRGPAIF